MLSAWEVYDKHNLYIKLFKWLLLKSRNFHLRGTDIICKIFSNAEMCVLSIEKLPLVFTFDYQ